MVREGYAKVRDPRLWREMDTEEPVRLQYRGSVFKIAMLDQWLVVVTGPSMIEELRKRPDTELSFNEGIGEVFRLCRREVR